MNPQRLLQYITVISLIGIVIVLMVFYKRSNPPRSTPQIIPTATPSATLAPLKSVPMFVPQNQSGSTQQPNPLQGSNPAAQPAQSSSTTNNSTTNNTTNNPPQNNGGNGNESNPVQNVLDTVTNLIN